MLLYRRLTHYEKQLKIRLEKLIEEEMAAFPSSLIKLLLLVQNGPGLYTDVTEKNKILDR